MKIKRIIFICLSVLIAGIVLFIFLKPIIAVKSCDYDETLGDNKAYELGYNAYGKKVF